MEDLLRITSRPRLLKSLGDCSATHLALLEAERLLVSSRFARGGSLRNRPKVYCSGLANLEDVVSFVGLPLDAVPELLLSLIVARCLPSPSLSQRPAQKQHR